jgi:hypothetical protein
MNNFKKRWVFYVSEKWPTGKDKRTVEVETAFPSSTNLHAGHGKKK